MGSAPLGSLLCILCITLLLISGGKPESGWGIHPHEPDVVCVGPCLSGDECFEQCKSLGFTNGGVCLGPGGSPVGVVVCCCKRNTVD